MKESIIVSDYQAIEKQQNKKNIKYFIVNIYSKSNPFLTEVGWIDEDFNKYKFISLLKQKNIRDARVVNSREVSKDKYLEIKNG